MSLKFSLRPMCIQDTGIDPETKKPPEGKMLDLLKRIETAQDNR